MTGGYDIGTARFHGSERYRSVTATGADVEPADGRLLRARYLVGRIGFGRSTRNMLATGNFRCLPRSQLSPPC
ncbi:hypothetical protein MRGA423_04100 [Mycobacterium tuberculosis RGTB423]|nr:hypothetical protein MRGA423_04100 [Mycobacterium tuberculosis RGTB423]